MNNRFGRALYGIAAGIIALVSGVLFFRRLRHEPESPPPDQPAKSETVPPIAPVDAVPLPLPAEPAIRRATRWTLALAVIGLGCLIAAQVLLASAHDSIIPVILYVVGAVAWLSVLHRGIGDKNPAPLGMVDSEQHVAPFGRWNVLAVALLTAIAWAIMWYSPTLSQGPAMLWLVPILYFGGRMFAGRLTGIIAAGLGAVSLWVFMLGQVGGMWGTLAMWSALYLILLLYAGWARSWMAWGMVVVAGGVGVLIAPEFLVMLLLLPITYALTANPRRPFEYIVRSGLYLLTGIVVCLFFLFPNFPTHVTPIVDYAKVVGYSPTIAAADAYFSGLLLFNLASDPNPLHGIVNRPVFDPILAGAFLAGLMGMGMAFYRPVKRRPPHAAAASTPFSSDRFRLRDWRAGLLIAALLVGLLPQAALINPNATYPNLQLAALAMPAAFIIAAWGLSRVALLLRELAGLTGLGLALILFAVALLLIAADAHYHFTEVFIPLFDRFAPAFYGS